MQKHFKNEIKQLFKQFAKVCVWVFVKHRQGEKKNILLFASRRGGSTWVTELIGACKGITYIDHALSIYTVSKYCLGFIPIAEDGHIRILDQETEKKIKKYFFEIFNNGLRVNAPWKFWTRTFSFYSDRLVLKITSAKSVIDFFDREFNCHILYFTRHPMACAQAAIRNNWGHHLKGYLENKLFLDKYLNQDQIDLSNEIYNRGTLIEKHVLNWVLENLIPIRLLPDRPGWMHLAYENLVADKYATVEKLTEFLEIDDAGPMKNQVGLPSRSTKRLSEERKGKIIIDGDVDGILSGWKTKSTSEERNSCKKILDVFDLKMYGSEEIMPLNKE